VRRIDERRPLPSSEGGASGPEVEWLGPAVAPWGTVRLAGVEEPLAGGFPVTVAGTPPVHFALFPLLSRSDVPGLWGMGGAATLTAQPLGPLKGFTVLKTADTDKGLLTLLRPVAPGYEPSVVDVQEAHAAARAAGGGIALALPFPFERRQEPASTDGPDLGEYAVAGVGGLLVGMVVARYL
jgi:hypothetical protein